MLNGIGGRTIAEAQANLSYNEYLTWVEFRRQRGSLFAGRRIEQATGYLSYITALANSRPGSRLQPIDFMPHEPRPKPSVADERAAFLRFMGS